ncbi:MAG: hypothetical protein IJT25_01305 [Clostridia bacterium]|nr:hypothetical protein [Clostridia bacterium]
MNKNVFYNMLYIAEYVSFIIATILVLIFQFTATQIIMVLSLILYVVAFSTMAVSEGVGVKELYARLNNAEKETNANSEILKEQPETELAIKAKEESEKIENNSDSAKNLKQEIKSKIRWGYAKIVMCSILSVFALLVLILF